MRLDTTSAIAGCGTALRAVTIIGTLTGIGVGAVAGHWAHLQRLDAGAGAVGAMLNAAMLAHAEQPLTTICRPIEWQAGDGARVRVRTIAIRALCAEPQAPKFEERALVAGPDTDFARLDTFIDPPLAALPIRATDACTQCHRSAEDEPVTVGTTLGTWLINIQPAPARVTWVGLGALGGAFLGGIPAFMLSLTVRRRLLKPLTELLDFAQRAALSSPQAHVSVGSVGAQMPHSTNEFHQIGGCIRTLRHRWAHAVSERGHKKD